ncbi:hypothetical protein [Psychrobacter sp. 4Bb]|uniref:hypothetical protein n=1 Tax=Psychrobacter sp. 4Bb TaxID=888436 RepID=UPI000C7CF49E|nr:hypothetical protein [Psychrobacter sp. 4Bb]PKH81162.1 hypothetical protein CXF60_06265 [Psychrobacter sp. 4Bb]
MPLTIRGAIADNMLYRATDTVVEKIKDLDGLSQRFNNELSAVLSDIGGITIADVEAPVRPQTPEAIVPSYEIGAFPTFDPANLSIPAMPAMTNIDKFLSNLDVTDLGPEPEAPTAISITAPQAPELERIDLPARPDIITTVDFPDAPTIDDIVMPERNSSTITIDIPDMPTVDTIAAPDRPDVDLSVNMPTAPTLKEYDAPVEPDFDTSITLPTLDAIDQLNAPVRPNIDTNVDIPKDYELVLPELAELEALKIDDFTIPEFEIPEAPNNAADLQPYEDFDADWWKGDVDNEYDNTHYDELVTVAKDMLARPENFGLPDAVVAALFNKPRERISREVERDVQEAVNTFAARGFSMPPGMLAKQANVARQEGQLRVADLNRDIFTEASKMQIEALRFAVEKGIALEQAAYDRHQDMINRLFEVAKYNVEAGFRLYEYQFTIFNTQNESYKILVDTYKTKLAMFIDGIRLRLDSKQAQGQLNAQELEVYRAKLAGATADAEVFKTNMLAVQMRVDIIKTQFDAYRTDMQAYAEQLGAERLKIEKYDAEMRGQQAKIGMAQTRADIYAKQIQAYGGKIEGERLKLDAYKTQIEGEQARLGVASTQAQIYGIDIDAYNARLGGEKVKLEMHEAALRGEAIKADIMQTEAGIYETDVRAALSKTEAGRLQLASFEAQIKAKLAELGIGETQARIYASDIDAYKAQNDAQKVKFEAFDSQIKAETAKADIYDSTVRAYASRVQSYASKSDVKVKQAQINIDAARAYVTTYLADVDGFKAELQAGLSEVQYNTQVFQAQVDGWRAQVAANTADSEMQSRYTDMNTRTNLAYAEMQMSEYSAKVSQAQESARIALQAATAAGQYTAQLAAGAMSAAHVSASISGSGSASVGSSDSESESTSYNYSY